jgi:hypothetical protein
MGDRRILDRALELALGRGGGIARRVAGADLSVALVAVAVVRAALVEVLTLFGQTTPDDFERKEVLSLLPENPPEPLDVMSVELPVSGRGALGIDQTLALEEPDLGDGHIRELFAEQRQDLADGEM